MIDRRFIALFLVTFGIVTFSGYLWLKIFYLQEELEQTEQKVENAQQALAYEEIDMIMPVQAFLKRGANSANLSVARRLFVNQWIYFNQADLIKLIMYAHGATSFQELKKAFEIGIQKEPKNGAISFVQSSLDVVSKDKNLIEHVNKSLREGWSSQLHTLRGRMMEVDQASKEYRKLKIEYRKALDEWFDQKYGELLDELITQV